MAAATCPACGAGVQPDYRFCEQCGHQLGTPVIAGPSVAAAAPAGAACWRSSGGTPDTCPGCGGSAFGVEGYCDNCGQRRPASEGHSEIDLGLLAGVTDLGRRHHRNEDAMGLGFIPATGVAVAVVCDGVSTSTRPDAASHAAVDAATPALLRSLAEGVEPSRALGVACRAAQAAAALVAGPEPGPNPPSSTFVASVVTADEISVGWVGDSRAYWLPDDGQAQCLTVDDSLSGQLAAAGVATGVPAGAYGGALVRWLGADARDTRPHLAALRPPGPGRVLVCSDGLFRYLDDAARVAATVPRTAPLAASRSLVDFAIRAGGVDNVTVVLITYPPEEP